MLSSVDQCLRLMYKIKQECEKQVNNSKTVPNETPMNIVSDHYTTSNTTQDKQEPYKVDNEKRTIRPSKSDSSLSSVPEKQSQISNDKESSINRVLSKSNFELSSPTSEGTPFSFESTAETTASLTPTQVTYALAPPIANAETVPYASYSSSDEEDVEFFDATTDMSEDKKEDRYRNVHVKCMLCDIKKRIIPVTVFDPC